VVAMDQRAAASAACRTWSEQRPETIRRIWFTRPFKQIEISGHMPVTPHSRAAQRAINHAKFLAGFTGDEGYTDQRGDHVY